MTRYVNAHRSQYAAGSSARTRVQGCTWASAANGVDAASGGSDDFTPDEILAQVQPREETNPQTPGWSLADLALAMRRLDVPFEIRSGSGWAGVVKALDAGLYVVLQGDSDRFGDATCSGSFNGDHAVGVHPDRDASGRQRINDPICKTARFESRTTLRSYAEKLNPKVSFGVFTTPVPLIGDAVRNFTILYDTAGRVVPAALTFPDAKALVLILATGKLIKVNTAWVKQGIKVRLKDPIVAGKPRTDDWVLGWLIGDDAAFVLDRNVVATGYPEDCRDEVMAAVSAAKSAARVKAEIVWE